MYGSCVTNPSRIYMRYNKCSRNDQKAPNKWFGTNEVRILTIQTVPGVGVVARLSSLVANVIHNLVFPFSRNLHNMMNKSRKCACKVPCTLKTTMKGCYLVHVCAARLSVWMHLYVYMWSKICLFSAIPVINHRQSLALCMQTIAIACLLLVFLDLWCCQRCSQYLVSSAIPFSFY